MANASPGPRATGPTADAQHAPAANLERMKRRPSKKATDARTGDHDQVAFLTLREAAEQIGVDPADLAGFIREAGLEPSGPESEWVLEAADVERLRAERAKSAQRNASELAKAARELG